MSESTATAWIIERLEIENTKMEEEMGNMDACEEESAGGNSGATPFGRGAWSSMSLFYLLYRRRYGAHATLNLHLIRYPNVVSNMSDSVGLNFLVPGHKNTSEHHQRFDV